VYNVAFHPSGRSLVSGDLMGVLKEWDTAEWSHCRDLDAAVLTGYDKTFQADCGGIRGIDFSPDGKHLAVSGISEVTNAFAGIGKPTVVLFDCESGQRLKVMLPAQNFQGTCWSVRFHPSGEFLVGAGGGNAGSLWFWKPSADKSFFDFKLPQVAYDAHFHPDGLRLAVALYDQTVRVYDLGPKIEVAAAGKK
jgi:WD40 repeat protein